MKKTGKELGMTVNSRRKRRRKQRKLQAKRNHPRKHNPAKERESQEGPRKTLLMLGCILLVTPSHSCPQLFPIPSHSHPLNHVASKDALQVDESDNDDGDDYLAGVSLKELGNAMECEKPVSSFIQDWELTKPKNMLWWQNQEWIPVNIFLGNLLETIQDQKDHDATDSERTLCLGEEGINMDKDKVFLNSVFCSQGSQQMKPHETYGNESESHTQVPPSPLLCSHSFKGYLADLDQSEVVTRTR